MRKHALRQIKSEQHFPGRVEQFGRSPHHQHVVVVGGKEALEPAVQQTRATIGRADGDQDAVGVAGQGRFDRPNNSLASAF